MCEKLETGFIYLAWDFELLQAYWFKGKKLWLWKQVFFFYAELYKKFQEIAEIKLHLFANKYKFKT